MKRDERHKGHGSLQNSHPPSDPPQRLSIPNPLDVRLQPNPKDNDHHSKERQYWSDQLASQRRLNRITGVGAGVAIVGIVASLLGVIYSVNSSKRALEATDRAWIKIDVGWPANPNGTAMLTVSNLGKSVAVRTQVSVWIETDDAASAPPLKENGLHGIQQWGLIFPGDKDSYPAERGQSNGTLWPFTASERSDLLSGAKYVVAYGIASYNDQFGYHWTRYCSWKLYAGSGARAEPCTAYEAIGDGEPPKAP